VTEQHHPIAVTSREQHTFYFAPEIEAGLVSIAWHEPERLGTIYRELDPAIHITQPHLCWLLEAIDLAYRDLGCVNFEVVIQVLRETGHLEDCGELEGVNQVYGLEEYGREDPGRNEKIFRHYLEMLKTYAVHRKMEPARLPHVFTSGSLVLHQNKVKTSQNSPEAIGEGKIAGRSYRTSMWIQTDEHGQKIFKVSLMPE
jgi:hypothetical protein